MPCDEETKRELGLVQVYTGDAKGKTTAALGLAFRACGRDLNTIMIQFLKPANSYGEHISAERSPNFTIMPMGADHLDGREVTREEDLELTRKAMAEAERALTSGKYDLVILDEINNTMDWKLADPADVIAMLERRAPHTEVVLTGRDAPKGIIEYADLVTEMKLIKHPFDKGIDARKGIEY